MHGRILSAGFKVDEPDAMANTVKVGLYLTMEPTTSLEADESIEFMSNAVGGNAVVWADWSYSGVFKHDCVRRFCMVLSDLLLCLMTVTCRSDDIRTPE